jgi:DNA-binding NarL/FixJ family response regulator
MSAPGAKSASAVVVAGDPELRALLRALLRLNRFRVDGEAEGATHALELVRVHRPPFLVVDSSLAEGKVFELVGQVRALVSEVRVVLVASASSPPRLPDDPSQRPDAVVFRPFRIRQFAEALMPGGTASGEGPT